VAIPASKPILGYEGLYMVYDDGSIFSVIKNKFLKPCKVSSGYMSVELFKDKTSKRVLIHRIVAQTFIDNSQSFPQVNHIDEDKSNNSAKNLEWCTAQYNMKYGLRLQKQLSNTDYSKIAEKMKVSQCGAGNNNAKPVIQILKNGVVVNAFPTAKCASTSLHIDHSHIIDTCKNKRKSAGGFIWQYGRRNDLSLSRY
jgi:hypothetical protein